MTTVYREMPGKIGSCRVYQKVAEFKEMMLAKRYVEAGQFGESFHFKYREINK